MAREVSSKKIAAVLVVTACFLAAVLWEVDFELAMLSLSEANKFLFVPMALCYLLGHTLRSVRLWILLEQQRPFKRIFAINSVGFLAINVMPLRMGELVRPYLLFEKESIPISRSLAAVLLERLLDMSMLLILLLGVAWVVELPPQGIELGGVDLIAVGQRGTGILILVGLVAGSLFVWGGERVDVLLMRLPRGSKLLTFARSFRKGLATLFSQPIRALLLLFISLSIWAL